MSDNAEIFREVAATFFPCNSNCSTNERPIPFDAPVIYQTFDFSIFILFYGCKIRMDLSYNGSRKKTDICKSQTNLKEVGFIPVCFLKNLLKCARSSKPKVSLICEIVQSVCLSKIFASVPIRSNIC